MKQIKISHLVLVFFFANETYAETTNQLGSPVFGAQLSISVSNNVIVAGSLIRLNQFRICFKAVTCSSNS